MGPGKWLLLFVLPAILLASVPVHALTGSVELLSPANDTWTNQTNDITTFTFRYTDPVNATALCELFINNPAQAKGSVSASNYTQESVQADQDFSNGPNDWWINCTNGTTITSSRWTFFSDRDPPIVNLVSPANQSSLEEGTINFDFRPTDALSPATYCILYAGGNTLGAPIMNDTQVSWPMMLVQGSYTWYVSCEDAALNSVVSGTFLLDIWSAFAVNITSPENKTYDYNDSIPLTFMVPGTPDWMGYSLDGAANVTVSGNRTFDVGTEGPHVIEVYANDSAGNMGHDAVHFTVSLSTGIGFSSPLDMAYGVDVVDVNLTTDRDADWCGLSLDGGSNVSMTKEAAWSWSYGLTGLSEGSHSVKAWCNDSSGAWMTNSTAFSVVTTEFSIVFLAPTNMTYWSTTSIYSLVSLGRNASMCRLSLGSAAPTPMLSSGPRTWYYNLTQISAGTHLLTVTCNDSSGLANSTSLAFTVKTAECESSGVGTCSGTQECVQGACVDLACSGCSYAANHACHRYECCLNDACLAGQECVGNSCIDIQCDCGVIQNHSCESYECCTNFDCPANHECNLTSHTCLKRSMFIDVPETVSAGGTFTVTVTDQKGDPVEGAEVTIEYPSGGEKTLTTDDEGKVSVTAIESGTIQISVSMAGYDTKAATTDVVSGFDWLIVFIVLIVVLAGVALFLYWQQLPDIGLGKEVSGQSVTLRVKNRSGEQLDNVLIVDAVPTGAFISCNVTPRIESYGSEDHITWFASLNPDEEITINYQAMRTSESFLVRVGDEEYHSGYGVVGILRELIDKIVKKLPVRKKSAAVAPAAPPATA